LHVFEHVWSLPLGNNMVTVYKNNPHNLKYLEIKPGKLFWESHEKFLKLVSNDFF